MHVQMNIEDADSVGRDGCCGACGMYIFFTAESQIDSILESLFYFLVMKFLPQKSLLSIFVTFVTLYRKSNCNEH